MPLPTFPTPEAYLAALPSDVAPYVLRFRALVRGLAPEATEVISYQMPAFKQRRVLLWYAATRAHFGLYPYPRTIAAFRDRLAGYSLSKGTIRLPWDQPLPVALIEDIVRFRLAEDARP